jgi:hypothetical protein
MFLVQTVERQCFGEIVVRNFIAILAILTVLQSAIRDKDPYYMTISVRIT